MANKHTSLKALFTDIADAIRGKTGDTGQIVADDFPKAISDITTQDYTVEDALVSGNITNYTNDRIITIAPHIFEDGGIVTIECGKVETVFRQAFENCADLESATFPSLKMVARNAFTGCIRLAYFKAPNLKYIESEAFARCSDLQKLEMCGLAKEINVIDNDAFFNSGLKALVLRGEFVTLTPTGLDACPIAYGLGYIYTPRSMLETYKTAENWSAFASQIRALEDYTVDGTVDGELDESKI